MSAYRLISAEKARTPVSMSCRLLGVSRATIYKYVPEVTTGYQAVALPPGQADVI